MNQNAQKGLAPPLPLSDLQPVTCSPQATSGEPLASGRTLLVGGNGTPGLVRMGDPPHCRCPSAAHQRAPVPAGTHLNSTAPPTMVPSTDTGSR
jgi:hypothetical protein